ncbi:hypothetical protein Tco_0646956, partial [Tanacetum coccineum]
VKMGKKAREWVLGFVGGKVGFIKVGGNSFSKLTLTLTVDLDFVGVNFVGFDFDFSSRSFHSRAWSRDVRDEIFSQHYRLRSLKQEKAIVTFNAIWIPVLALESWAGYNITMQGELQELRGRVTTLEQERIRRGQ